MQHFFNAPSRVVDETLTATAHAAPLRIAEPGSGVRILVRADWRRDSHGREQVAVLSGGGSGHEPAHAGFIGDGMLTGAIAGSLFASPSVEAVLAAIRETCGEAGCLLVVKNYTGDRLNFGLAAERARGEGLKVAMVIVGDDIALPDTAQPRGLAGTLLVHKVAGHHARQGESLESVRQRAETLCRRMASLGMALGGATLPGQTETRHDAELGLGIHNEPGARRVAPNDADEAMGLVLGPLCEALSRRDAAPPWVVLLNNLGGCSTQEMAVLGASLIARLGDDATDLIGPAALMTSLDMPGFSVTLAPADDDLLAALDAPTTAPAWPGLARLQPPATFSPRLDSDDEALRDDAPQDERLAAPLRRALDALDAAREELDALDARSGDGDAGSSLAEGAASVRRALTSRRLDTVHPAALLAGIGQCLARDMGGSSGVLLSILFTAAAASDDATPAARLAAGIERLQVYGGAGAGDRTMLDALLPAIEALQDGQGWQAAARAARQGADATADMHQARAGRSAYVPPESLDGVVDPGAEAVARVFAALAAAD
ncbi:MULTISPECIES: dihydroxyacetone kinase subunit DhaK [unclassified Modicisalibacter]|uniref:dihydroxyacetone kinase subunit DhaK n=1 Tax=unclassified Modicisalibacter TaxID=2679913 RepID=UPI001CCBF784|nr:MULTISPECIES: dihydroxyacetone kinase subunit DhaK [unclassified Modicisalibacter]MBZ9556496.1 dihydroxyacetone kinase subunit DhaK [Modicisalibacter sp. R2A 31.J]MBZ9575035.1 dihydroxyacetone kinase subunit DhaK [Modicisalibacter sp. MOD 31.J]